MGPPHRKPFRSFNTPGHAHELTFSRFRRLPLLSRDRTRQWFLDALDAARHRRNLALWAYVIMPEHVHVIVWPRETAYEVRLIRTALKVPVQRKALAFCAATHRIICLGCGTSSRTGKCITASGSGAAGMIGTSPTPALCGP
jgi:putative transposase